VGVHQTGQHHAAGQVDDLGIRLRRANPTERPPVGDHAVDHRDPRVDLRAQQPASER
jgi:hypothetical protein